ncbi:hypothetical protein PS15m_003319 [Mucor circinelloides]
MLGCDFCGRGLTEWDYMTECGHLICGYGCYNENEQVCPICKKRTKFACIGEKVKDVYNSLCMCVCVSLICSCEIKAPRNGTGFLTSTRSLFNDAEKIIEFRFNAMANLIEYLRSKIEKQDKVIDQAKHELKQLKYYKAFVLRCTYAKPCLTALDLGKYMN